MLPAVISTGNVKTEQACGGEGVAWTVLEAIHKIRQHAATQRRQRCNEKARQITGVFSGTTQPAYPRQTGHRCKQPELDERIDGGSKKDMQTSIRLH